VAFSHGMKPRSTIKSAVESQGERQKRGATSHKLSDEFCENVRPLVSPTRLECAITLPTMSLGESCPDFVVTLPGTIVLCSVATPSMKIPPSPPAKLLLIVELLLWKTPELVPAVTVPLYTAPPRPDARFPERVLLISVTCPGSDECARL